MKQKGKEQRKSAHNCTESRENKNNRDEVIWMNVLKESGNKKREKYAFRKYLKQLIPASCVALEKDLLESGIPAEEVSELVELYRNFDPEYCRRIKKHKNVIKKFEEEDKAFKEALK